MGPNGKNIEKVNAVSPTVGKLVMALIDQNDSSISRRFLFDNLASEDADKWTV